MSTRPGQVPRLDLTAEQQLALVYFHVAHEDGLLPTLSRAVLGNGKPEEGLKWKVDQLIVRRRNGFWKRLGYDVLKNVATIAVVAVGGGIVAIFLAGLRVSFALTGAPP